MFPSRSGLSSSSGRTCLTCLTARITPKALVQSVFPARRLRARATARQAAASDWSATPLATSLARLASDPASRSTCSWLLNSFSSDHSTRTEERAFASPRRPLSFLLNLRFPHGARTQRSSLPNCQRSTMPAAALEEPDALLDRFNTGEFVLRGRQS